MDIDPRVEPWLIALLEGVQNSNSHAEVVATGAYAAPALAKALEGLVETVVSGTVYDAESDPSYFNGAIDVLFEAVDVGGAALALARGETP